MTRQREMYETLLAHPDAPFIAKRPALFSPAAAAQDKANLKQTFGRFAQILLPSEYAGWMVESVAHVRSCYLGDWTSLSKVIVSGPDALAFLSWLGMNDLSSFAVGQVKHHVQLDEHGWVASEGVICRQGEQEYLYTAGSCDWLLWQFGQGSWSAEVSDVSPDQFIFGVQGPHSLAVCERLCGDSLRDIAFNHGRPALAAGHSVWILRTGISGELGYELHGPADAANAIWSAIVEVGEEFGLCQLGIRSQPVQHIEAGIATNGLDYMPAAAITPGAPRQFRRGQIGGSFVPSAFTDYFRTPRELGWGPRAIAAHDFLGRDALLAAEGERHRLLVGLCWNAEDVVAVYASLFGEGEPAEQMELPRLQGPSFDQVLCSGVSVGVSTGRTVSLHMGAMISLGVIDVEHAHPGREVTVVWGRPGTPQRQIRARVSALPFKPDRRRVDVTAV